MTWERWIRRLKERRLIKANVDPVPAPRDAPWTSQALSMLGAWLAAVFLLGFFAVAIANVLDEPAWQVGLGVSMCALVAFASWGASSRTATTLAPTTQTQDTQTQTTQTQTTQTQTTQTQTTQTQTTQTQTTQTRAQTAQLPPGQTTPSRLMPSHSVPRSITVPSSRAPLAFLSQFLSAVSFAGLMLLIHGSGELDTPLRGASASALSGLLASLALCKLNGDPLHRIYMAWLAVASFAALLISLHATQAVVVVLALLTTVVWLAQRRWLLGTNAAMLAPLGHASATIGLGLALMPTPSALGVVGWPIAATGLAWNPWVTIAVFLVLVAVVLRLSERWEVRRPVLIGALCAMLLLTLASARMPGVLMCVLVWTLGTASGRPGLRALSMIGLPIGVFLLYYDLQSTLLIKGLSLLGAGTVLVVASLVLRIIAVDGDDDA